MIVCALLFLVIWPSQGVAQTWIEVTGLAELGNRTMEETRQAALQDARRQAVEAVAGVQVGSFSMVRDYVLLADAINSSSYGVIVDEEIGEWRTESIQKDIKTPPLLLVKVRIRAKVAIPEGNPDPGFIVTAKLSKNVYGAGDEMRIEARATQDCWITLVNLTADGKALVLVPSKVRTDAELEAHQAFQFPDESERAAGIRLRVRAVPGHRRDREAIVLVASKTQHPLPPSLSGESDYSVEQFGKWMVSIPLGDRTVTVLPYEVAARE